MKKDLNKLKMLIQFYSLFWILSVINSLPFKLTEKEKEIVSVRLHVLTAENQNRSFEIKYNQFEKNQFSNVCSEKSKPLLKFIVHGFSETWNMTYRWNWVNDMAAEMFKSSESSKLCVIAVDWKELAKGGDLISNYWKAISNMQIAADLLTEFFKYNKINEKNMHCIGFSLGAHMCGVFFQVYFDKFKIKPARITGLDPAGTRT